MQRFVAMLTPMVLILVIATALGREVRAADPFCGGNQGTPGSTLTCPTCSGRLVAANGPSHGPSAVLPPGQFGWFLRPRILPPWGYVARPVWIPGYATQR